MSAKKHVSRVSAESRWQEGIFLGVLGAGDGASDCAIGTPDGVQPARAIKMVLEIDAWDIEPVGSQGTSKGSLASRPCSENSSPSFRSTTRARLASCGRTSGPRARRVYIRRDVEIRKYGVTIVCLGCMAITTGTTVQGHSDECQDRAEGAPGHPRNWSDAP